MIEKAPIKPLLFNGGFWGPKGSHIYYVRDGDDFTNLAKRDGWSNVWDFIHFNFQTYVPEEVNWYLHRYVGCTKTDDGMNYKFSSSDRVRMTDGSSQRGHVFTRKRIYHVPPPENPHETAKQSVIKALEQYRSLFAPMRFIIFGVHFNCSDLNKIREYIENGRILVAHRPTQGSAGVYYPGYNALHLRNKLLRGVGEKALIVHECAHAALDMNSVSVTRHQSEAIAYIVQCVVAGYEGKVLYTVNSKHNSGTTSCAGHGDEDCKFVIADQIADKIRTGTRRISKADEKRMLDAMKGDPHYGSKSGRPNYNGIPKRTIGPLPPVVPSGA